MADYSEDPHDVDVYAPPQSADLRFVQAATAQGICRITLNRPPANVLSVEMMQEIASVLEGLEYEKSTRLVVLNAAGTLFLCRLRDHGPPGRPRLPDARGLPSDLRSHLQARQADPRRGRRGRTRRRMHACGWLRHGSCGPERQARLSRDPWRRLQHRGCSASSRHRRTEEGLRDPAPRQQPNGSRSRAHRPRDAGRGRRGPGGRGNAASFSASRRARLPCFSSPDAPSLAGFDLPDPRPSATPRTST